MNDVTNNEEQVDIRWNKAIELYRSGDKSGALFMFKAFVNDGELAAIREVANIYEQPSSGGVEQDFKKTRKWYARSIEEADDVYGCIGLGRMLYYGKGGPRDYNMAFEYYSMIEDKDIPVVNLMFGRMYSLGHGVIKDYDKSIYYYQKAIKGGNLIALKDLGLLEIEMKKYVHGIYHYLKAAINIIIALTRSKHDPRLRTQ